MSRRAKLSLIGTYKYLEALSFIVIILGVPAFFYQQWQTSETRRTEETLKFITMFQQERIVSAKADLLLPWIQYSDEIKVINAGRGLDQVMLHRWVEKLIEASVNHNPEKNLVHAIFIMTDFFDQLYLCVSMNVCQEEPAQQYFREYTSQFDYLFGHKIEEWRVDLSISDFGRGIRYFATTRSDRHTKAEAQ